MKTLFHLFFITLGLLSAQANAQIPDQLGDLGSLPLLVDQHKLKISIHYPGYRLGGGTPPRRDISDCLIVDIQSTDERVDLNQKMEVAQKLIVKDGYGDEEEAFTLHPEVKGENVVFKLVTNGYYVTDIHVRTKSGKTLKEEILESVPPTSHPTNTIPVNLVYVRACRF